MSGPPYVDTHAVEVAAPRDQVWPVLRDFADRVGVPPRLRLLGVLWGTEPRSGFGVTDEVPGERVELSGRHRFSRYRLVFTLADAPGGTRLSALTYAAFPGLHGSAYRLVVVRSGAHVLATRAMLRGLARRV